MKKVNFKEFNNQKTLLKVVLDFLGNLFFCYCLIIAGALILFSSVTVECEVVGTSMLPNFNNNIGYHHDCVYINIYDRELKYNDIVVIQDDTTSIIKRVVGVSGDKIDFVKINDEYRLELNGKIIEEDYILIDNDPRIETDNKNGMKNTYNNFQILKTNKPELFNENDKLVVPQNSVFVLGDNRFVSSDSSLVGTFEINQIEGKVELTKRYDESQFGFYWDYIVQGKFFTTLKNIF